MGNNLKKEHSDLKTSFDVLKNEHALAKISLERRGEQQSALHQRVCDLEGLVLEMKQEYAQLHYKYRRDMESQNKAVHMAQSQTAILQNQLDAVIKQKDAHEKNYENYYHIPKNWCCIRSNDHTSPKC